MNDNFIKRFAIDPNLANAELQLIKEFELDISDLKSKGNEIDYIYGYMCGFLSHHFSSIAFDFLNTKLFIAFYNIYGEQFINYVIKKSNNIITKEMFIERINS